MAIVYALLTFGAVIMIFPMLWMLGASLKPEWQILTQPLAFPSEWIHVQAGTANQEFPLWSVIGPDGERVEVITIGSRRYTTAVDAAALTGLLSVPADALSSATPIEINGVLLNVRVWSQPDGTTEQVVALSRDGDNLVVMPVAALAEHALEVALSEVNRGKRARPEVEGYELQGREMEDGRVLVSLGPESQRTVVAPAQAAAAALLVPAEAPINPELVTIGSTEVQHYNLEGYPSDQYFVLLSSETWQPIIDMDVAREYGFTVAASALGQTRETRSFGDALLPVTTAPLPAGSVGEVVVLMENSQRALVVPVEHSDTIRLAPLGKLSEPFVERFDGIALRYKNDYGAHGANESVGIVGTQRNMALVIPQDAFSDAFDVDAGVPERVLRPRLYIENFIDALTRDLGGATFFTFFGNSILLVVLNLIGHFLSVTIVAYGFARLRAPGKNILFMILLATMMMPFPVLLIPTYEIFQSLGMINTLWPLFLRAFFGNAFLIFLMRQFFMSIPLELEDAARIDGANTVQILWYVMLPLSKPALATMAIFTFWWTWNSFFEPYVYLSSIKNFTVSLGLGFFRSQYTYTFHLLMAAAVITILPVISLFFFAQRYFIEGIQLSGLKG
jgi:multiple sugar transport system permease protein